MRCSKQNDEGYGGGVCPYTSCYSHFVDNLGYDVSRPLGCKYGVSRDYMTNNTLCTDGKPTHHLKYP